MKNYDEMAAAVFCRRDEYEKKRKEKKKTRQKLLGVTLPVLCVGVAVLVGIHLYRPQPDAILPPGDAAVSSDISSQAADEQSTAGDLSSEPIAPDESDEPSESDTPYEPDNEWAPAPMEFEFKSFKELAEMRNALREGEDSFQDYCENAPYYTMIHTRNHAEWVLELLESIPIPMLKGGRLSLSYFGGADYEYDTVGFVYLDVRNGDFMFLVVTPNCTLDKYLTNFYKGPERQLIAEKEYGGYTIGFYENPYYEDDFWWTIGVLEVDGNVITMRRGRNSTYGYTRDPNITLDDLMSPLEHFTLTTLDELIGP